MTIALVSLGTVSFANPAAPSFGASTTAGNLLVAWVASAFSGISFPTCSSGTWTKAVQIAGATSSISQIWYKENCGAGETAPTFNNAGGVGAVLGEFSGALTASALDQTGSSGGTTSPRTATAGAADATSGSLFVSSGSWFLSKNATNTTANTFNNGATPTGNLNNDSTSVGSHYRFAYGFTTGNSSADQDSQSNDSMNIVSGALTVASFKVAAVAADTIYTQPTNFQDPGIMFKKLSQTWKRKNRIFIPDFWLPIPVIS